MTIEKLFEQTTAQINRRLREYHPYEADGYVPKVQIDPEELARLKKESAAKKKLEDEKAERRRKRLEAKWKAQGIPEPDYGKPDPWAYDGYYDSYPNRIP